MYTKVYPRWTRLDGTLDAGPTEIARLHKPKFTGRSHCARGTL